MSLEVSSTRCDEDLRFSIEGRPTHGFLGLKYRKLRATFTQITPNYQELDRSESGLSSILNASG